jgi:hypothetical protein
LTQILPKLTGRISRRQDASQPRQRGRKRLQVAAALLGLGLGTSMPAAQAATNVVFVSGAFMRSISVADLESLAQTGQARGLLADVLILSKQKPADVAKLLNQQLTLPIVLTSRLLNTRIGEAILARVAQIVFPLKAKAYGVPALKAGVILGLERAKIIAERSNLIMEPTSTLHDQYRLACNSFGINHRLLGEPVIRRHDQLERLPNQGSAGEIRVIDRFWQEQQIMRAV